jgi:hypothetical protein
MFAGNLEDAIEKFACSGDLPTRKLRILPYRAPLLGGDFLECGGYTVLGISQTTRKPISG